MANILVYIELSGDRASDTSLLLLRQGRTFASRLGATLYAVLPCAAPPLYGDDDIIAILSKQGADKVILITNPALHTPPVFENHGVALVAAASQFPPALFLLPNSPAGCDMGPRIATKTGAAYAFNPRLSFDEDQHLVVAQPIYNATHARVFNTGDMEFPLVAVVSPETHQINGPAGCEEAEVVVISPSFDNGQPHMSITEAAADAPHRPNPGGVVILLGHEVSSGDVDTLRRLAARLGAELRLTGDAAKNLGEAAPNITPSLRAVPPRLLLAVGVHGSGELRSYLDESTFVVAINRDPLSPMVEEASVALIGPVIDSTEQMLLELEERGIDAARDAEAVPQLRMASGTDANPEAAPEADSGPNRVVGNEEPPPASGVGEER